VQPGEVEASIHTPRTAVQTRRERTASCGSDRTDGPIRRRPVHRRGLVPFSLQPRDRPKSRRIGSFTRSKRAPAGRKRPPGIRRCSPRHRDRLDLAIAPRILPAKQRVGGALTVVVIGQTGRHHGATIAETAPDSNTGTAVSVAESVRFGEVPTGRNFRKGYRRNLLGPQRLWSATDCSSQGPLPGPVDGARLMGHLLLRPASPTAQVSQRRRTFLTQTRPPRPRDELTTPIHDTRPSCDGGRPFRCDKYLTARYLPIPSNVAAR
jgi:hypothetical protein